MRHCAPQPGDRPGGGRQLGGRTAERWWSHTDEPAFRIVAIGLYGEAAGFAEQVADLIVGEGGTIRGGLDGMRVGQVVVVAHPLLLGELAQLIIDVRVRPLGTLDAGQAIEAIVKEGGIAADRILDALDVADGVQAVREVLKDSHGPVGGDVRQPPPVGIVGVGG